MIKEKKLNKNESQRCMSEWIKSMGNSLPDLDTVYMSLRTELEQLYKETEDSWKPEMGRHDYYYDVDFGIKLYVFFKKHFGDSLRIASDNDFWRYLSIMVIPHIVAKRWSYDNEDHYWKKPTRIWLSSIWWYVHISWLGDPESTKKMLLGFMFNTDTILNLVERTGRGGRYLEVNSTIMKVYSLLNKETIETYERKTQKNDTLFRAIMRLHTAKAIVTEPAFCQGGVLGYVLSLYQVYGINANYSKGCFEITTKTDSLASVSIMEDKANNNEINETQDSLKIKVLWKS